MSKHVMLELSESVRGYVTVTARHRNHLWHFRFSPKIETNWKMDEMMHLIHMTQIPRTKLCERFARPTFGVHFRASRTEWLQSVVDNVLPLVTILFFIAAERIDIKLDIDFPRSRPSHHRMVITSAAWIDSMELHVILAILNYNVENWKRREVAHQL